MQNRPTSADDLTPDHYTQRSITVLYHARAEVTAAAARSIEPNHILIGILRADSALVRERMREDWTVERLITTITVHNPGVQPLDESIGVPMSMAGGRLLMRAFDIAETLGETKIRPAHILLAFLDDVTGNFSELLNGVGIERNDVLETLKHR
ncbi:MAG: Clp protease N-terminal domain-containing protein [Vicinamibacterales bacterium]